MSHGLSTPCRLHPLQCQPLFLVQPVHQMLAHFPAFAVQLYADLAISIAHSCLSDLADPHPQLSPWIAVAPVAVRASRHAQNPARSPLAYTVAAYQLIYRRPTP